MNNNPDLRVIKTKKVIKLVFLNQLQTIGYNKISVSSITKEALINRGTFYLHYKNKEDLLNSLQMDFINNLIKHININPLNMTHMTLNKELEHLLLSFYQYCEANKQEIITLFYSQDNSIFYNLLKTTMNKIFTNISKLNHIAEELTIPAHYLITMIASIHSGITEEWLLNNRDNSAEEIATLVYTMIKSIPQSIFSN
ncbi:MAG: TetR/AcrR family transcriptional regulator [Mycoplasmatales bacterium]